MRTQQQTGASFMHAADASAPWEDQRRHTFIWTLTRFTAEMMSHVTQTCSLMQLSVSIRAAATERGALTSARGSTTRFSVMMSDPAHALALR